jgi:tRNA-Thr(GGU) m(6)t(6)A37 methyltransferase TsaA
MNVKLKPIGVIHSPFKTKEDVIRDKEKEAIAEIEVFKEYQEGLEDIDGFSHIIIVWLFHESEGYSLKVKPLHYEELCGVFATRHPNRPNPLGVTIVELLEINQNLLKVKGIDAFDKTPLLDIKPYTRSDRKEKTKFGWLGEKEKNKRNSK